ncbi:MAG: ABC transporter ATP-binding protein [Candidatus Bathyarchaeia archaeon]
MARILLKNLTKRFGNVVAVNNLSLEVKDKEFLVLLGPSGCGKTTVLRCIAGLETQDEGEIYVGETLVNDLPPKERDVAMVFQSYALYPHMTAYENIAFPLKVKAVAASEIDQRVKKVADLLKITHLLDRKPKQLSGGEAQRVALGRALIREPKAFLMDEPLSNLDAKLRIYMRAELKKLQKDLGITTIYVTHDQVEAMTMADRVALLNQGILQQVGSPEELYQHPSNLFTAGFIGSPPMNFIDCHLTKEAEKVYLDAGIFKLSLEEHLVEMFKDRNAGEEFVIGIRPEDITLERKEKRDVVQGEIFTLEPLGAEVIADIKVGETIFKVKENAMFKAKAGEKVWLSFEKDKIYVFDKKTGKALFR